MYTITIIDGKEFVKLESEREIIRPCRLKSVNGEEFKAIECYDRNGNKMTGSEDAYIDLFSPRKRREKIIIKCKHPCNGKRFIKRKVKDICILKNDRKYRLFARV